MTVSPTQPLQTGPAIAPAQPIEDLLRSARSFAQRAPQDYLVEQRSIGAVLLERAAQAPQQIFLRYHDDERGEQASLTYAQVAQRAQQLARVLAQRYGVRRGDCVATLAYNHPDVVCVYFACWLLGAIAAPQSSAEDDARIAFILENAHACLLLAHGDYLARAQTLAQRAPQVRHVLSLTELLDAAITDASHELQPPAHDLREDVCLLVYTSGTTGAPKGVQLTQYNLLVNAQGMVQWHALDAQARLMCVLPIHHVNGILVTLITPLYAGASVVLCRAFKAGAFWRRLAQERVNIVSVVPTLLQFLCEANEDIGALDLRALRYIICGAGTLAVGLAERFETRFGVRMLHGYGLSETTAFATNMPPDLSAADHRHWLSDYGYPAIGVAFGAHEVQIHDAEGKPLAAGERGEIVIRGHDVMLGYFGRADANAETLKHGWLRSGDEGFYQCDALGRAFFFITGRLKELINRGGVKYSPFEIEEVMLEVPGVKVALAIAFDNDWYGEEVGAYVVPQAQARLDEAQIIAHCRARMPYAKCPKVVKFGAEVPVTVTGKYQRLRLKDVFSEYRGVQFKELR